MIASLPMYDRAETAAANDRLWSAIRDEMGEGPERLNRGTDPRDDWRRPDLLFSQTCSLPFRLGLDDRLHLVAAPDHRLEGCRPGFYCSVLIARAADPREDFAAFSGARLAYNGADSQSGWAAPQAHAAAAGVGFGAFLETGAHRLSARAVAGGEADLAALDAVTWKMVAEWDDVADRLKVICRTAPTPALPFVTAKARMVLPLRAALARAIGRIGAADRARLRLFGTVELPVDDYLALPLPTPP